MAGFEKRRSVEPLERFEHHACQEQIAVTIRVQTIVAQVGAA